MMIDKIQVRVTDFEVKDSSNLIVQPSPYRYSDHSQKANFVLFSRGAELVEGSKAYYNDEDGNYNATIQSFRNQPYLSISYSPAKVHNGSNYYSVGKGGVLAVGKWIEKDMRENGIYFSLDNSELSRLDLCRNVATDYRFTDYSKVLSLLDGRRKKQRCYGTTFLWLSGVEQICVYDKLEEMRNKGEVIPSGLPSNVIRFETRLMKKRKIRGSLGSSNYLELVNQYDALKDHYREMMSTNLFRYNMDEVKVVCADRIEDEMRWYKDMYQGHWYSRYVKRKGFDYVLDEVGIEVYKEALKALLDDESDSNKKKKLYRIMKELKGYQVERLTMERMREGGTTTLYSLYEELRTKVLSA